MVLATNVAETSLTVPGIKYVIDPGTARISRYSNRTKVQRLPIEPISQASASQRAGRSGRTSDGICIRLYSEADFDARPEFTEPEILRTSLASVILRMADLDLGEVADFPFIDPPDARNVTDGIRLLEELGAVTQAAGRLRLTDTGTKLAHLPLDPRLGRMILEAGRHGCAREVLIITAALSIQDPRERPADARPQADAMHARFAEPGSDFLTFVTLWDYLRDQQRELSSSAFRRMCRREFLHYLRTREWQDVYGQLRQAARDLGVDAGPDRDARDRAATARRRRARPGQGAALRGRAVRRGAPVAAGRAAVPSRDAGRRGQGGRRPVGRRRRPARSAAAPRSSRGRGAAVSPSSPIRSWPGSRRPGSWPPSWSRRRGCGPGPRPRIEPEWAEALAGPLARRTYSEPHWDARRGAAMATEKVTLYGLPIVAARPVSYGRVNPAAARELFIRSALVEGDWTTRHRFFHENRRLLDEAEDLERRARRRGIVADDAALFDFYDDRIPASVTSARHFDSWWKKARQSDPDLLTFSPAELVGPAAEQVRLDDYPGRWGGLPLSYEFAPGEPDDGVTADIPLAELNQVNAAEFGWQVPGLREELVTELIRSLPKSLRTALRARPGHRPRGAARARPGPGDLPGDCCGVLGAELGRRAGAEIPRDALDLSRLPPHLRITFRVTDGDKVLATGKDLAALRRQLAPRLRATLTQAAAGITRTGLRTWDLGTLPRVFEDGRVRAYPALADAGDHVDIRLFDTEAQARRGDGAGHPAADPAAGRLRRARGGGRRCRSASSWPSAGTRTPARPTCSTTAPRPRPTRSSPTPAAGLGRGGLRGAADGGPARPGPGRRRRGGDGGPGARRGARGRGGAGPGGRQRGAGAGGRGHARPAGRAGLPGLHLRDGRPAAARPGPLPARHRPAPGEGPGRPGPRRGPDGRRAAGDPGLRPAPARAGRRGPGRRRRRRGG